MKRLMQKVLEAGLVPQHTLELMKHWQIVPEDAQVGDVSDADQEKLLSFVKDIATLLEEDREIPEMRETALDMDQLYLTAIMVPVFITGGNQLVQVELPTARDRAGNFIFSYHVHPSVGAAVRPGNRILWQNVEYDITEVTPSYVEEKPTYLVCAVQEVPPHAQVQHMQTVRLQH